MSASDSRADCAELDARLEASEKRVRDLELLLCGLVAELRPKLGSRARGALARARAGTDEDDWARFE